LFFKEKPSLQVVHIDPDEQVKQPVGHSKIKWKNNLIKMLVLFNNIYAIFY
jgi:hypothetical protein